MTTLPAPTGRPWAIISPAQLLILADPITTAAVLYPPASVFFKTYGWTTPPAPTYTAREVARISAMRAEQRGAVEEWVA